MIPWQWLNIYEKLKAVGLCTSTRKRAYCPNPATHGSLCESHRLRHRESSSRSQARLYMKRKLAGLCVDCGKNPVETSVQCKDCSDIATARVAKKWKKKKYREHRVALERARRRAREEKGLCVACSSPSVTRLYCERHRRKMLADWRSRSNKAPDTKHPCKNCSKFGHRANTCLERKKYSSETVQYATARNEWLF